MLTERKENLIEVGRRIRYESNKYEWFKGVRRKEEKLTMGEKPPLKRISLGLDIRL